MFRINVTAIGDVFDDNNEIVLVEKTYGYQDIDMFEISNPDFAYKFAEICREEMKKIKAERLQNKSGELTEEELKYLADNQIPY